MSAAVSKLNWRAIIGFELCWFLLVYFQQLAFWPVLAYLLYGSWRLVGTRRRLAVLIIALLGIAIDSALIQLDILSFSLRDSLPLWFWLLWGVFALAVVELLADFLQKPWLAFVLGATGGPLSYIGGAALSGGVLSFPAGYVSYGVLALIWGGLAVLYGQSRRFYV
ncbi:hypothetical protein A9165_13275 [Alishewanella sp. HH-ZS]|jgi:hypothetical protein|nr:hypothetical protein A9165_13275 [Alishewanella sp. HH-ZS]